MLGDDGFGILCLPLIVMRDRKLLEQQLAQAGLPQSGASRQVADGGSVINDAMLAGALDIAGTGAPDFMHRAGSIRMLPARWSEMFVPTLAGRDGS